MADSQQTFALQRIQDLPTYENVRDSIDKASRGSADSIKRLEKLIFDQKDRLEQMRHLSIVTPSQIRLQASMQDVLIISQQTLTQIRLSASCLKISSGILDT